MKEAIIISEEETAEIAKMMKDRMLKDSAPATVDLTAEAGEIEPTAEELAEYEAGMAQAKKIAQQLKKRLKPMSKSDLIKIIITYASDLQEMQAVSRQLFEENKELKGENK